MKNKKSILFDLLFFIVLIVLTYYVIFKDYNLNIIVDNLKNLNRLYLLIAFIFMILYFLLEAFNIKMLLNSFKEKISLFKSFVYSLICFFFSAITPASSGGQPMTIYSLSKENIKISHSSLSYLIQLFGYDIAAFTLGIVFAIVRKDLFVNNLLTFFIIGSLFNLIPITITAIGIFSTNLLNKIVKLIIKILKFFKIKKIDSITQKINEELALFNESSEYIKKNKPTFYKSILISFIQVIVYYCVPFFIFKSFNLSGFSIILFIQLQAILHNSIASIPLPGSVGITETIFLLLFSFVYTNTYLESALIVNRIVTFYVFVFISLIVYIINKIILEKKKIIN